MGKIAEVFTGDRQQGCRTESGVIKGFHAHHLLEQIAAMALEVVEQHLAHVALSRAVTKQKDCVGIGHRRRDAGEIVGVTRGPLTRRIAIVAVGEVLITSPDAMGAQHRMLCILALKPEHVGGVVIEVQHKAPALIAPRRGGVGLGMVRGDTSLLEDMTHAHQGLGVEVGLTDAAAGLDPGFLATRQTQAQSAIAEFGDLGPKGTAEGLDLGPPHPMLQGVGVERLERTQMVAFHGSFRC